MLSAAQRQSKLAKKAKAKKARDLDARRANAAALYRWRERQAAEEDRALLVVCMREDLYGQGDADGFYSPEQVAHVDAIIDAYTPEEFAQQVELNLARRGDIEGRDHDGS